MKINRLRNNRCYLAGAMEKDADILKGMEAISGVADGLDEELQSGNLSWKHIGQYLNEEWAARKSLFKVHTKRLDEIMQFLGARKILGAKVCGAAAGGSILVLVDPGQKDHLAEDCEKHGIKVLSTKATREGVFSK